MPPKIVQRRHQQRRQIQHQYHRHRLHTLAVLSQLHRRRLLWQPPPPPRVGSDVSHAAAHRGNKACCALPDAWCRPSRRPPPASLSSCAEYARRLLRIECAVRESCCAGAEPDTWELQKLFLQDANSPNIISRKFIISKREKTNLGAICKRCCCF